jgi:predicted ATPase/class 3 adenylate cyclase
MPDERDPRRDLPTGTVTFLRTDVEGSMALARALGVSWDAINAAHMGILRQAVERHGGVCVRSEGDALFAVFPEAGAALLAAVDGQRELTAHLWPEDATVRVRMGLHTGEAHLAGDDYGGFDVNRAARVAAVGHGGQIVVSGTTEALVAASLPSEITIRDLGRHALKDVPMAEHLFQVDVPGLRTDFPPLRVVGDTRGNLPRRLTSLVGRSDDLLELTGLLDDARLITLTGPGGIGKTSLAIELASLRAESMPDGAWFVALDSVTDPDEVGSVIARTLGLFDGIERPAVDALPRFIAERSMLLVLDNFEQVLDAAAEVAGLLRASPGSRFIVTSRAPLRVAGEQEYPVRPLTIGGGSAGMGDPSGSSFRLFVDRARAVRPGWEPGPDAPLVVEVCELLDGLPLGIELAAARLSLLPVRGIRDRLAARLPLPGSGPRDAPARQRTLDGAIEWSHDLLEPDDQRTLHELGVFDGTFDAEQAERVVTSDPARMGTDVLDRLVTLADRSLISRDLAPLGDDARLAASGIRFGLLRTVQGFAAGRLNADGHDADTRGRHAAAYLELAEAAAQHLNTGRQPPWLDRLARDDANLRAALRWSIASGDIDRAFRMLGALWRYWLLTGQLTQGAEWAAAVFKMPGSDRPTAARVGALAAAGGIAYWRADTEASGRFYEDQLEVARLVDDGPGMADGYWNVASAAFIAGDLTKSAEYGHEARQRFIELGDDVAVNRLDWSMTTMTMYVDGPQAATGELRRVLERAEALEDVPYVAMAAGGLAWAAYMLGDIPTAGRWTLRTMLAGYGNRDLAGSTVSLPIGAIMALALGKPREAATILGAFEALAERFGVRPPMALAAMIAGADPLERARESLQPGEFNEALERGRRMTLGETLDLVVGLGMS